MRAFPQPVESSSQQQHTPLGPTPPTPAGRWALRRFICQDTQRVCVCLFLKKIVCVIRTTSQEVMFMSLHLNKTQPLLMFLSVFKHGCSHSCHHSGSGPHQSPNGSHPGPPDAAPPFLVSSPLPASAPCLALLPLPDFEILVFLKA